MANRVLSKPTIHHLVKTIPKPLRFSTHPKPRISCPSHFPHKNFIPLSKLLHRYGFPSCDVSVVLTRNPFLFNFSLTNVEKSLNILLSINPHQEFLTSMVKNCPIVLDHQFLVKWTEGIARMRLSYMNWASIRNVLEVSGKFDLDPDDFFRCVECMEGLGLNHGAVNAVLEVFPDVVMMNEDSIRNKLEFLMNFGIGREDLNYVVAYFPGVLAFGVENRTKPLLEEFKELGFNLDVVKKEVLREPMVLGLEVGEFSQCLKLLRSLKCRVGTRQEILREGEFHAVYEVKLRVDCLRKHGLIYADAFTVIWKEPRLILYKVEDIEKKIDFLVCTMKYDIMCLVDVPEYLGVNFKKQIVPRYNVIKYLRSRGALGDEVGLRNLIKPSRLKFYNFYVKPYPECEKIYGRLTSDLEVRNQHPIGMWKLFKPQNFPGSKEDAMHIKSYMESLG